MRKSVWMVCFLTLLALFAGGCAKTKPDTYIEGSDYQYMQVDSMPSAPQKQVGDGGIYLLRNHYIYFWDEEEHILLPLCNKADCLHDRATMNKDSCNAYVQESSMWTGINYCNGWLYWVDRIDPDDGDGNVLYRLSADGSTKEQLHQWDPYIDGGVENWLVHRDVFYYANGYASSDTGLQTKSTLKKMSLEGGVAGKEEVIFESEEGWETLSLRPLNAYGNHLYISNSYYEEGDTDFFKGGTYVYDIEKNQLSELCVPDQKEDESVSKIAFWKGGLLMRTAGEGADFDDTYPLYSANLDGSNPKLVMEEVAVGDNFFSDGTWLYQTNADTVFSMKKQGREVEDEIIYRVFDENFEEVDTFALPFTYAVTISMGDGKGLYIPITDDPADQLPFVDPEDPRPSWELRYWDKSDIGQLNGKSFSTETLYRWEE